MKKIGSLAIILDRINEFGEVEITSFEFGDEHLELGRIVLSILYQIEAPYSYQKLDNRLSIKMSSI